MGYLGTIVTVFAPRILVLFAYLAGLIFAIVRRDKHPRISLLAGISFGVLTVMTVLDAVISLLPLFSRDVIDLSISQIGMIMSVYRFVAAFLEAGAIVLLIFAIFGGRADLDDED